MKKNVLALQRLTSKTQSKNHGGDDNGSHLSVSGCDGDSGLSLLICSK